MPHAGEDFRVQLLSDTARLPSRAHPGDAGLDLYAAEAATLEPGERAMVGCGIAIAIPEGCAGLVLPVSYTHLTLPTILRV